MRRSGTRREDRRARRVQQHMDRAWRRAERRRRGPGLRSLGSVLTISAAAVGGILALQSMGVDPGDLARLAHPRSYVEVEGRAVAVPVPPAADGRLLAAVPVTTAGSHAFLHTARDGSPVGYDPCRAIGYVTRADGMPPDGQALLEDAMAIVSRASGLALVTLGSTDEAPLVDRPLIQAERYGQGWAPVLVAWSGPEEVPELAGQVAGVGGSAAVPGARGSGTWLAGGRLILDGPDLTGMLERPGGYEQARAVVVHEIAHVLGLDHVEDPDELMHPVTSTRTDLGPGDLQGLALVGQVACEE